MKKLTKILVFISFTLLSSRCTDNFLEKAPQAVLFEENLANKEGLESLLIGAYGMLDGVLEVYWFGGAFSGSNWVYGDVYADDAYKGSTIWDQEEIVFMERYEQNQNLLYYNVKWKSVYEGIARCNSLIRITEKALDANSITEEEAIQYLAEARFLRGYFHFEAIKVWDFIPFIDETNTDGLVENSPASSTDGDVRWADLEMNGYIPWDRLELDFNYAIEHLPIDSRNGHKGRAYKYPAMAIMAKVNLYQEKYEQALLQLNTIIESGRFKLSDHYHENFTVDGDNNLESIFQIQASVGDGTKGDQNGNYGDLANFPMEWLPDEYPAPGKCCGFYQPSQNLVNSYKTTDGQVGNGILQGLPYLEFYNLYFNMEGDDVKNDADPPIEYSDPFVEDTRPLDPRLDWTIGRRGIPYLDWGDHPGSCWIREPNFLFGPYTPKKNSYYKEEENIYSTAQGVGWAPGLNANNYSILRYADILLMAAECEVETGGDLSRARDLVNQVRARAKNGSWVLENGADDDGSHLGPDGELPAANYIIDIYPNTGLSDPFQTVEGAREAVRFERRLEFGMEGHRFWDLKRWGIAKTTLNNYLEKESQIRLYLVGASFKDENIRHPIPQGEIDLMKGLLKQNPGYQ